jgi:ligand-binding SRPBCC domain-containing protein
MKLRFECHLSCPVEKLISGFDERLFRALSPPFPRVLIRQFDGVKKGDKVDLELDFLLFKWKWSGSIIASAYSENGFTFIDRGEILPPFLSSWEHHHILESSKSGSIIRDEIEFSSGKGWPDWLVRLMIRIQMNPRNRIYRAYFTP